MLHRGYPPCRSKKRIVKWKRCSDRPPSPMRMMECPLWGRYLVPNAIGLLVVNCVLPLASRLNINQDVKSWQREAVRFAFKEDMLSSERCFSNSGSAVSSPSSLLKLELITRPLAVCFYVSDHNRMIKSIYDEHARQVYCGETTLVQALGYVLFHSSKASRADPGASGQGEEEEEEKDRSGHNRKGITSFTLSHLHVMPWLGVSRHVMRWRMAPIRC